MEPQRRTATDGNESEYESKAGKAHARLADGRGSLGRRRRRLRGRC